MKKNTQNTVKNNEVASHLLFTPERKVIAADIAQKMAARCSDYNDSRSEARNFNCMEFNGIKISGEDLSGIETHYAKFVDCEFSECKFSRMEAYFSEFENCTFSNCDLEDSDFSFAKIINTVFFNCNSNGVNFSFVRGNFSFTGCMLERASADNADLHLILSQSNAAGFSANCAKIELDVSGSSLHRAELCDSTVSGKIVQTDLTGAELNRSDLSELEIIDCATHNMETEDSSGDMFDDALEDVLNDFEEEFLED